MVNHLKICSLGYNNKQGNDDADAADRLQQVMKARYSDRIFQRKLEFMLDFIK